MQPFLVEKLIETFTQIPFNKMLGLSLDQLDTEQVTMSFSMKESLIGNFLQGILHGGVISSVLDMAGGMVVMAAGIAAHSDRSLEEVVELVGKTSTVDLQISYLRPGRGEMFTAKAWLMKSGKKISFTRMELTNQEGILIASGNGTYLVR